MRRLTIHVSVVELEDRWPRVGVGRRPRQGEDVVFRVAATASLAPTRSTTRAPGTASAARATTSAAASKAVEASGRGSGRWSRVGRHLRGERRQRSCIWRRSRRMRCRRSCIWRRNRTWRVRCRCNWGHLGLGAWRRHCRCICKHLWTCIWRRRCRCIWEHRWVWQPRWRHVWSGRCRWRRSRSDGGCGSVCVDSLRRGRLRKVAAAAPCRPLVVGCRHVCRPTEGAACCPR